MVNRRRLNSESMERSGIKPQGRRFKSYLRSHKKEPLKRFFFWLPLTRSRADVRARSEAESFAPQGQALSGARERKLCGTANLFFFVAAPDPLSGRRSCSERSGELCPAGASPVRGSHDCRRKGCKTKNHEKQCVFHGFLLFKWQK